MSLYTVTLTDDEVDAICRAHSPASLAHRLQDSEFGISDQSRSLLLTQAAGGYRAELETPLWSIALWPLRNNDGTPNVSQWGGFGTLQFGGMGHTVRQVSGDSAEEVLDKILDFHGCGPNRNVGGELRKIVTDYEE